MNKEEFTIIPNEIKTKLNNLKRINAALIISDNIKKQDTLNREVNFNNRFIITAETILDMVNIKTIDDLNNYVKNNTNYIEWFNPIDKMYQYYSISKEIDMKHELSFDTINRIVQAWVVHNFNILKTHNKSLINIMVLLCPFPPKFINNNILLKEATDYVEYWFDKHEQNEFELDLLNSFYIYIYKKNKYIY
jgi:hypothetical protein